VMGARPQRHLAQPQEVRDLITFLVTRTCSKILVGLTQKLKSNADKSKAVPLI